MGTLLLVTQVNLVLYVCTPARRRRRQDRVISRNAGICGVDWCLRGSYNGQHRGIQYWLLPVDTGATKRRPLVVAGMCLKELLVKAAAKRTTEYCRHRDRIEIVVWGLVGMS